MGSNPISSTKCLRLPMSQVAQKDLCLAVIKSTFEMNNTERARGHVTMLHLSCDARDEVFGRHSRPERSTEFGKR